MGKHEKIFLAESSMPRALIFGMKNHLVDVYQVCSNKAPDAKKVPALGATFNIMLI